MPRLGRIYIVVLVVSVLAALVWPSTAGAAGNTYVVAPNGRDNGRGDVGDPLRTIEAGVARLQPGDTLLVRGGDYSSPYGPDAPVDLNGLRGTADQPIRIANYPGERPLRRGSGWQVFRVFNSTYVTIEGFEVFGSALTNHDPTVGVVVDSSNHIAVVNNLIHDLGGSGIAAIHSDHVRSEGNQIWGTTLWSAYQESAINYFELADSNSGPGIFGFNNAIVGNIVFHNETRVTNSDGIVTDGNCINIDSSRNRGYTGATAIVNNVCVANGGRGIVIGHSDNVLVLNNTLTGNNLRLDQPGAELNAVYASNVTFRNNLVSPTRSDRALIVYDAQNVTAENNVYVASLPAQMGPGDQLVPSLPLLLGAIPPAGSVATDAGSTVGGPGTDIFGNARHGRPDAGAVER